MPNVAEEVRWILDTYAKGIPIDKRGTFIAVNMARALSMEAQLPSSPVESIQIFYGNSVYSMVTDFLSRFNELYVVDVKQVLDYTFKFYKLRYQMVYEPTAIVPMMLGINVIDEIVAKDILEVTNGSTECIEAMRLMIGAFMRALKEGVPETPVDAPSTPAAAAPLPIM